MPTTHIETSELPGLGHVETMLRQIDHRTQDSFAHARTISKPWGDLESVLTWCKTELVEDWRWQLIDMASGQQAGRYIFYFDSDRDAMVFALKWC